MPTSCWLRPDITRTSLRNFSSGFITRWYSKSAPVVGGSQAWGMIPVGAYTYIMRSGEFGVVLANAGTIASRNGNAMAVPAPRNNVLRDSCLMVAYSPFGPWTEAGPVTFAF